MTKLQSNNENDRICDWVDEVRRKAKEEGYEILDIKTDGAIRTIGEVKDTNEFKSVVESMSKGSKYTMGTHKASK